MAYAMLVILFFLIPCLFISLIYYTIKMWYQRSKNQNYQEDTMYHNMKKRRKFVAIAIPVSCVLFIIFSVINTNHEKEETQKKILLKAESYTGDDKIFFERKFSELKDSMGETDAREKAVKLTDKNIEDNERINNLNENDKVFFNEKFNEYINSMNEFDAKEKALNDLDEEISKRNKELQKKYDDQKQYEEWIAWQKSEEEKKVAEEKRIAEEKERQELQKKYDNQKQYEEWIAWQKSEKEKAEKAELQKKYEDQEKYEEWIAWQKNEEEKANAEREKKRAGLNRLEKNGQIQYVNLGNNTYNVIITESAKFNYSKKKLTDLLNYATQSEHERNIVSTAKQCMELVQDVQDAEINVNNYTINLTGEVVDGQGYKRTDNVVICEISGSAKFVRGDPYSFYNNCSRYWMIRGL